MSEFEDILPDDELIQRGKTFEELFRKYSNSKDTEEDGLEINDLLAIQEALDEETSEKWDENEEADEASSTEDEEFAENNMLPLVPYETMKTDREQAYNGFVKIYGKEFVDGLKEAYAKRYYEASQLNLPFWKSSTSSENLHVNGIKTKDYETFSRQYAKTSEESFASAIPPGTPQHFRSPFVVPSASVPDFKYPYQPSFNITANPSLSFHPGINSTFNQAPMYQVPGSNHQMYNVRVREVFYDYFSVTGNNTSEQILSPPLPVNVSRAIDYQPIVPLDQSVQTNQVKIDEKARQAKEKTSPPKREAVRSTTVDSKKSKTLKSKKKAERDESLETKSKKMPAKTKSIATNNKKDASATEVSLPMSYSDCVKLNQNSEMKLNEVTDPFKEIDTRINAVQMTKSRENIQKETAASRKRNDSRVNTDKLTDFRENMQKEEATSKNETDSRSYGGKPKELRERTRKNTASSKQETDSQQNVELQNPVPSNTNSTRPNKKAIASVEAPKQENRKSAESEDRRPPPLKNKEKSKRKGKKKYRQIRIDESSSEDLSFTVFHRVAAQVSKPVQDEKNEKDKATNLKKSTSVDKTKGNKSKSNKTCHSSLLPIKETEALKNITTKTPASKEPVNLLNSDCDTSLDDYDYFKEANRKYFEQVRTLAEDSMQKK